jgi:hypothetical protein
MRPRDIGLVYRTKSSAIDRSPLIRAPEGPLVEVSARQSYINRGIAAFPDIRRISHAHRNRRQA